MAESPDVNTLRRRGRRRLVGAIALVLLAAIVLPMVFDQEPKPAVAPVNLRIPSEDGAGLSLKAPAKPAVPQGQGATKAAESDRPAQSATAERAATPAKPAAAAVASAPAPEAKKPPAKSEAAPAPAAPQFVVPVAALASPEKVKELLARLNAAKLPHYTEPIATAKGTVTRVRVGPYASRQAAETAGERLQRLGLKPGKVLEKP